MTACPKCGADCELVDWSEADIGVGIQTFDHEYRCPAHGGFAYVRTDDEPRSPLEAVFRDAPSDPGSGE